MGDRGGSGRAGRSLSAEGRAEVFDERSPQGRGHRRRSSSSVPRTSGSHRFEGAPGDVTPGWAGPPERLKGATENSAQRRERLRERKRERSLARGRKTNAQSGAADGGGGESGAEGTPAQPVQRWRAVETDSSDEDAAEADARAVLEGAAEVLVEALHTALLDAGIRGSLREQARALEARSHTHRRRPSDLDCGATSPGPSDQPSPLLLHLLQGAVDSTRLGGALASAGFGRVAARRSELAGAKLNPERVAAAAAQWARQSRTAVAARLSAATANARMSAHSDARSNPEQGPGIQPSPLVFGRVRSPLHRHSVRRQATLAAQSGGAGLPEASDWESDGRSSEGEARAARDSMHSGEVGPCHSAEEEEEAEVDETAEWEDEAEDEAEASADLPLPDAADDPSTHAPSPGRHPASPARRAASSPTVQRRSNDSARSVRSPHAAVPLQGLSPVHFGSFDPLLLDAPDTAPSAPEPAADPAEPPATRISGVVPSAVETRILWERTVSGLEQLLPAGAVEEELAANLRGRSDSDPAAQALLRATSRVALVCEATRSLFALPAMLVAPDAAHLRLALREAREFADTLAGVFPAARPQLLDRLAAAVADTAAIAQDGIATLASYLQSQAEEQGEEDSGRPRRRVSTLSLDSGGPCASSEISGVVAAGKPLSEALHALLRWGRDVAEFVDPQDLQRLEALAQSFTAAFLQVALLWGGLVAAAHAARRPGTDTWRWATALEAMGKEQLMFVRTLSLQGFAQGCLGGADFAALKATVDTTVQVVKALEEELCAPGHAMPTSGEGTEDAVAAGVPPREQWEVEMTDVRLGEKVGAGSYGQVWRATWRAAPVAVKLFDKVWADSEAHMAAVRREAALMARHRHPHVLLFMGVCTRPPNLAIVTEFCDNGSLHDVLSRKRDTPDDLPWARRLMFAADAARGLNYLHTSRPATIHADLNASNLLVDRGMRVKVADFGLSRLLGNAGRGVVNGTNVSNKNASHLAPEVLRGEPYGTPSDVFSFGCVLWELATLAVPWGALQALGNNLVIAHRIAYGGQRLALPAEVQPAFSDLADYNALIGDCFLEDPAARPKMEVVLERLVLLQQRVIKRQREEAAGMVTLLPAPALRAAPPAEAAKAPIMQAAQPSSAPGTLAPHPHVMSSWLLLAALPVASAIVSWAITRRAYAQR